MCLQTQLNSIGESVSISHFAHLLFCISKKKKNQEKHFSKYKKLFENLILFLFPSPFSTATLQKGDRNPATDCFIYWLLPLCLIKPKFILFMQKLNVKFQFSIRFQVLHKSNKPPQVGVKNFLQNRFFPPPNFGAFTSVFSATLQNMYKSLWMETQPEMMSII